MNGNLLQMLKDIDAVGATSRFPRGGCPDPGSRMTIAGNLKEMLGRRRGSGTTSFSAADRGPTIRIDGLTVAGADDRIRANSRWRLRRPIRRAIVCGFTASAF